MLSCWNVYFNPILDSIIELTSLQSFEESWDLKLTSKSGLIAEILVGIRPSLRPEASAKVESGGKPATTIGRVTLDASSCSPPVAAHTSRNLNDSSYEDVEAKAEKIRKLLEKMDPPTVLYKTKDARFQKQPTQTNSKCPIPSYRIRLQRAESAPSDTSKTSDVAVKAPDVVKAVESELTIRK